MSEKSKWSLLALLLLVLLPPLPLRAQSQAPAATLTAAPAGVATPAEAAVQAQPSAPNDIDRAELRVTEGVIRLFKQMPGRLWPGYDLAVQPFIVYRPGRWALLVSYAGEVPGFSAYPSDWPSLGHPVQFHSGAYENLVGQLAFGLPLDGTSVVAIGLPDSVPPLWGLEGASFEELAIGYIVHEAFHQYQNEAFGEIPWEREERYPMLARDNTALAAVEMRMLADAVAAAAAGDMDDCAKLTRTFIAVRAHRWQTSSPFVRRFEQGLELNEGTAKYVEVRALDLVKDLKYHSDLQAGEPLAKKLAGLTAHGLVLKDIQTRMCAGSISPDDMPRNRVYPVGSAQALLLDDFGVKWKAAAQRAGPEFTYVDLLKSSVKYSERDAARLLAEAKGKYGYERVLAVTDSLATAYDQSYAEAMKSFLGQSGYRIEITTVRSGMGRSRVSSKRKWLMDSGRQSLCLGYEAYSLKSDQLFLQIAASPVLEESDWEAGTLKVVLYSSGAPELKLDGEPLALESGGDVQRTFDSIELSAENIVLRWDTRGTIEVCKTSGAMRILLDLTGR